MNTRQVGKKLEEYVADKLQEALQDLTIKPTKNSGASTQLADILSKQFIVECKKRNTTSISIKEEVWNKLLNEIPVGSLRIPLYILENKNQKRWCVLDFEDFCTIIKKKNE
jgi:hypothetical protein